MPFFHFTLLLYKDEKKKVTKSKKISTLFKTNDFIVIPFKKHFIHEQVTLSLVSKCLNK